jgi:hypothetical protein
MNQSRIAKHFNVSPGAIVKWRMVDEGAKVRALIDYGLGGIKVYEVPLDEFVTQEPLPLPVPAAIDLDSDLSGHTVAELREMAKDAGIAYAGLRKSELVEALEDYDASEL